MLLQRCQEDKLCAIALSVLTNECLTALGIQAPQNVSALCAKLELNRTQVYEKKKQLAAALETLQTSGRGRPRQGASAILKKTSAGRSLAECEQRIAALEFRLAHPGAVVVHMSGHATYSDSFKRFILDAADQWEDTDEIFCRAVGTPCTTLATWRSIDAKEPITPQPPPTRTPVWPVDSQPNEAARAITEDYKMWQGAVTGFLGYEARKLHIAPAAIRRVLTIAGVLSASNKKGHRHRGSTENGSPGAIAVTDGKDIEVNLTYSGEKHTVNWQGIVDQATACHLTVVVSSSESAASVASAYNGAVEFLGRPPQALLHDQKPIYWDVNLQQHIGSTTTMIPATMARPENKAVIEGEFGKFEQAVGAITIDDQNKNTLATSVTREVVRAYTAGINHAARAELNGKSRLEVVREACPDPKKDAELIASLKATHQRGRRPDAPLPTKPIAYDILNAAFEKFGLAPHDESHRLRGWLAGAFEPEAIRRGLAIFEAKREQGRLRTKHAHRYLIKVIQSEQIEINLEREEHHLLAYAEIERVSWLTELRKERLSVRADAENHEAYLTGLTNLALCGSIFIEKAFWEKSLDEALAAAPSSFPRVMTHIRRVYEVSESCRRRLMNHLITHHTELTRMIH